MDGDIFIADFIAAKMKAYDAGHLMIHVHV